MTKEVCNWANSFRSNTLIGMECAIVFPMKVLMVAATCILLSAGHVQAAKANVTLNGYTFAEDSADLWENQYFSSYYAEDEPCLYYGSWIYIGFGDFAHDYVAHFFDRIETYKDITCVVYREHGFWQGKWVPAIGEDPYDPGYIPGYYMGERYTRYNFLAKDMNGNIHVLKSLRPNETDLDDIGIIAEGGTTLMYPEEPALEQPVYGGYVVGVDASSLQIVRWINYGLKSDTIAPITITLHPAHGVIRMDYNWMDASDVFGDAWGINGYSMDESMNTYGSKPDYTPENVMIHGYTFDSNSANIWENQFFGDYTASTISSYTKVMYGYGDFRSYDIGIYFDSFSTANNVNCVVLRDHGYIPEGTSTTDAATGTTTTTFTFTPYTKYNYLAKDTAGNIHLLRSVSGDSDLSADAITAAGGTTILYPGTPVENQLVSNGMVVGTNSTIDTFTGCMSIRRGSSPDVTFDYYQPSSGLVTSVYNWGSTANGFSVNKNPQISSLPTAGGTNTTAVNTDPASASSADDDEDKMWYECFIGASTCPEGTSASNAMMLAVMAACIILRMSLGTARTENRSK